MSDSILKIERLFEAISDPEYRFLLMEPLIFYGIFFGIILFLFSYFMKVDKFQIVALVIIGLSALTHLPYLKARDSAQPRMAQVYKLSSPSRVKAFQTNTSNWKQNSWVFIALAAAASATLLVGSRRNKLGFWFSIATVLFGLLGIKDSLWLHYQDSLAYHPNLKKHYAPITEKKKSTAKVTPTPPSIPAPPKPRTIGSTVSRPKPAPIAPQPRTVTAPVEVRTVSRSLPPAPAPAPAPAPTPRRPVTVAQHPPAPPIQVNPTTRQLSTNRIAPPPPPSSYRQPAPAPAIRYQPPEPTRFQYQSPDPINTYQPPAPYTPGTRTVQPIR